VNTVSSASISEKCRVSKESRRFIFGTAKSRPRRYQIRNTIIASRATAFSLSLSLSLSLSQSVPPCDKRVCYQFLLRSFVRLRIVRVHFACKKRESGNNALNAARNVWSFKPFLADKFSVRIYQEDKHLLLGMVYTSTSSTRCFLKPAISRFRTIRHAACSRFLPDDGKR